MAMQPPSAMCGGPAWAASPIITAKGPAGRATEVAIPLGLNLLYRNGHACSQSGWRRAAAIDGARPRQVRTRLLAGGKWIRTIGPPPEIVVDPSG
jgi:hypothetical protein